MTKIHADFSSVLGTRTDGVIVIAATPDRAGGTGWLSGAEVETPLVDGAAIIDDVAPGPARVTVRLDGDGDTEHWHQSWRVTIPDDPVATIPLADLIEGQVDWPAPVVGQAQAAAARAEAAADRAEEAADSMEGGVRPGGWLLDDMAQEVLDQFGGGVSIPAGGWPKTDLAATVRASLDKADTAVQGTDPRLTDARTPKTHTHPVTDLTTTGATTGQVLSVGAGGIPAWAAAAGGTPGFAASSTDVAPTTPNINSVSAGGGARGSDSGWSSAYGYAARALADSAVAIGANAKVDSGHTKSVALGMGSATTKANQVMLGRATETVTMPGKAELGTGTTQVTLSTRLEGGKVQLGITFPGSPDFIPIATQP